MLKLRTMFAVGVGAAAAYLLDPENGESRRKRLTGQVDSKVKHTLHRDEHSQGASSGGQPSSAATTAPAAAGPSTMGTAGGDAGASARQSYIGQS